MASVYPGALDTFATNKNDATITATDHPAHHNNLADAVNKIEAELGTDPAGAEATVNARLAAIEADISGMSSGGLALIERKVAAGATAVLDFTGIAATWESLKLVVHGRSDASAGSVNLNMRFNNDSGANYAKQSVFFNDTAVGAARSTGQTAMRIGVVAAANSAANTPGINEILIPGYARSVFHKMAIGQAAWDEGGGPGFVSSVESGVWASTAAITRVTLLPSSGNFITGSVATLYGLIGV